jgi:hypothetical protein
MAALGLPFGPRIRVTVSLLVRNAAASLAPPPRRTNKKRRARFTAAISVSENSGALFFGASRRQTWRLVRIVVVTRRLYGGRRADALGR